ncbi:MAG TPA: nucleoid-associated protein, partial [Bacteroidia bacterium]|nr:nucleoid-associated protein [Bacteroidia bacterium]
MALSPSFKDAQLVAMSLAKVGNPVRNEPLRTSQRLCRFRDEEAELLTHCFLKSFRALELHQLHHHSDLAKNELFAAASAIFDDNDTLLEQGATIARHLHAKSNHPNIKSGDLCVALIDQVGVLGERVQALSIVKSESRVPFLQISERDGDLVLTTEQGIYPDKIDKGCLVLNHGRADGYSVYLFDKGGGNTQFWVREFLGAQPVRNDDFLTRRFSELCVAFAQRGLPEETRQEERMDVASRSLNYIKDADEFDLGEFEAKALVEPQRIAQFEAFKADYEEEQGQPLEERFAVSKKEAEKAEGRLKSRMKLDVGVELRFSSGFIRQA